MLCLKKGKKIRPMPRKAHEFRDFRGYLNWSYTPTCRHASPVLWADTRHFSFDSTVLEMPGPNRPVDIRIGLMMLGDTAVIVSNGEIFNLIGQRLKARTSFKNTMMVTHTGQWIGYVKDDSGSGIYEQKAAQAVDELVDSFLNQ